LGHKQQLKCKPRGGTCFAPWTVGTLGINVCLSRWNEWNGILRTKKEGPLGLQGDN
jgi:hypothetical protein